VTQALLADPEADGYRRPSSRMWTARQVSLALAALPLTLAALIPAWVFGSAAAGAPATAGVAGLLALARVVKLVDTQL